MEKRRMPSESYQTDLICAILDYDKRCADKLEQHRDFVLSFHGVMETFDADKALEVVGLVPANPNKLYFL
jgi:phage replication-related protein YjqB (UPF0714/DUF867 family)